MGFHETNVAALTQAVAYMGRQFVFRGVTYKGIINELEADSVLSVGADAMQFAVAVYVRKTGFPVPSNGEAVYIDGIKHRIAMITSDSISYTLQLEHPTQ